MIINIAWPDNPVWAYSMSDTLHILEINGNSLIDKTVEEIQNIIPGIDTNKLSKAPVRPPLQERRRMSEANHSLSKCGDIRAQIHKAPSQSVSHYFFVPRLDLYL